MSQIEALAASEFKHGTHASYVKKCRCMECKAAESSYRTCRRRARMAGDWLGLVDARRARIRLMELAQEGIGRIRISLATGIPASKIQEIRSGKRGRVRADTERKILEITVARAGAGGGFVTVSA